MERGVDREVSWGLIFFLCWLGVNKQALESGWCLGSPGILSPNYLFVRLKDNPYARGGHFFHISTSVCQTGVSEIDLVQHVAVPFGQL